MDHRPLTAFSLLLLLTGVSVCAYADTSPVPLKGTTSAATDADLRPADASVPGASSPKAVPPMVSAPPETAPPKARENRRWLIKRRDAVKAPPQKARTFKWDKAQQRARCQEYAARLNQAFQQARYFSIQGDSCNTAAFADRFLETYGAGMAACPEGYLASQGFRDLIPRNMTRLVELGEARCQDRPVAAAPHAHTQPAAAP